MFYVYAYYRDGLPYYIGKGQKNRAYVKQNHPELPKNIDDIRILSHFEDNVNALIREWELISFLGLKKEGGILENKTIINNPPDHTGKVFPKGVRRRWHHTEETKAKLRKPKNYVRTAEHSEKIARQNRGRKQSPESIRKRVEKLKGNRCNVGNTNRALSYIITFPDGHEEIVYNMAAFCREHNLSPAGMCWVAKGNARHHKKFKCRYESK